MTPTNSVQNSPPKQPDLPRDHHAKRFRHINFTSPAWWTWIVIAGLLVAGLSGQEDARLAAMWIAAGQAALYVTRHRSLAHFPTQVRVAYALWMAASFFDVLVPLFWIQAAGTSALVLLGYCPLARMLLVLPWNRTVPLTWRGLAVMAFHPPIRGDVRSGLPI